MGLDCNARKDRTGSTKEEIVGEYLIKNVGRENVLNQAGKEKIYKTFHLSEINSL